MVLSLQVYVDESGGKNQSRSFIMSGVMASVEVWDSFSDEWDRVLRQSPRLEYFKMREAVRRNEQFNGWSQPSVDERLKQLADVALKHNIVHFVEASDLRAFTQFSLKEMLPRPANNPYFFGFHRMISMVASHLVSKGQTEEFEIFFDVNETFGHKAKRFYPLIKILKKGSPEEKILPIEPIFRDDKKTLPLQFADMLAWLMREAGEEKRHWLFDYLGTIECYSHITTVGDMLALARSEVEIMTQEQWAEWQAEIEDLK